MVLTAGASLRTAKTGRAVSWQAARTRGTAPMVPSVSPLQAVLATVPVRQDSMLNLMEPALTLMNVSQHLDPVVLELCVKTRLDLSAACVPLVPQETRTLGSAPPTKPSAPETTTADLMRSVWSQASVSAPLLSSQTQQTEESVRAPVKDSCAG